MASDYMKCPQCGMHFRSASLMEKHFRQFCVGRAISQLSNDSDTSAYVPKQKADKVREVLAYKEKKTKHRAERDNAEKILLSKGSTSKDLPVPTYNRSRTEGDILGMEEMERIISKEAKIKEQIENLRAQIQAKSRASSAASTDDITLRSNQIRHHVPTDNKGDDTLRRLHKKYLELENQRQGILERLEALSAAGNRTVPSQLLKETQIQEDKTKPLIEEIKREIRDLKLQARGVSETPHKSRISPVVVPYRAHNLASEINAAKTSYINRGGSDPQIIRQMNEMVAEAVNLESQQPPTAIQPSINTGLHPYTGVPPFAPSPYDPYSLKVMQYELENQKLHQELEVLRSKKSAEEDETIKLQREHAIRMMNLQHEMEVLKHESLIRKMREEAKPLRPPPQMQPPPPPNPSYLLSYQNPPAVHDPLNPSPYDPSSGFVVFYDFMLNIDPGYSRIRLVVGLFNGAHEIGSAIALPVKETLANSTYYSQPDQMVFAMISAKQPVQRCRPSQDLNLVVEVQASNHYESELRTIGWTKFLLFDDQLRVLSGRWKVPIRTIPVRQELTPKELNTVPQYGLLELYYRLCNYRDSDVQSVARIGPNQAFEYTFPPTSFSNTSVYYPAPAPPVPATPKPPSPVVDPGLDEYTGVPSIHGDPVPVTFTLKYIKNAPRGEAHLRLTVYKKSTNDIVSLPQGPFSYTSKTVLSNHMENYHMFGKEMIRFDDVSPKSDMLAMVRLYLKPKIVVYRDNEQVVRTDQNVILDDEKLVAWGAIALMNHSGDVNIGTHTVPLYQMPIPQPSEIPFEYTNYAKSGFRRFGSAELQLSISTLGSMPRLDEGESDEEYDPNLPSDYSDMLERPFILNSRHTPLTEPFSASDGFDIYIDAARFLPDTVTITRVAGRVLDRRYSKIGQDISTNINIDSDIYNPVYDYRCEFRAQAVPPSATLLVKLYTIDRHNRQLTVIGYSALNIFVESGTLRQPANDAYGTQVSLNSGGHQLRIYHQAPDALKPLSVNNLPEEHRYIPCASLLVRIHKTPLGNDGRPLEAQFVSKEDYTRLGLVINRPEYSSGKYISSNAIPTSGENKMMRAMARRNFLPVRQGLSLVADGKEKKLGLDREIENSIRNQLTRLLDTQPVDHIIHHITPYIPQFGLKVACDAAINLPWTRFTHAMMLLNPPGAFYYGGDYSKYDRIVFTSYLDFDSEIKSPTFFDPFKVFRNRSYNSNLALIVHLHEIEVKPEGNNYRYQLQDQAWTAINVFSLNYVCTQSFQLPLIEGAPSQEVLQELARTPVKQALHELALENKIRFIEGSSVFVRISDARRDEELEAVVHTNTEYLPEDSSSFYTKKLPSNTFRTIIPKGKETEAFQDTLAKRFRMLIEKLVEDGDPYRLTYN